MAQTLLSTRPVGRATSRTTSSVMSVGTRAARFGQAIHSPQAGAMRSRSPGSWASNSSRQRTNVTITSSVPAAGSPSARPAPDSAARPSANPAGAPRTATAWPGMMPSLRGSGVPEYLGGPRPPGGEVTSDLDELDAGQVAEVAP